MEFEDRDKTVSWELPIMHKHTKWDKTYWLPKVGELVYVLTPALGNGLGVILGSSYNAEDAPPVEDINTVKILFEDGTTIEYDKKSHKLYIHSVGDIEIVSNTHITIKAPRIDLNPKRRLAMPPVVRKGDKSCGHGCYPPRPNDEGSPNVFVNSIPVHRFGDYWESHCCPPPCHDGVASGVLHLYYLT